MPITTANILVGAGILKIGDTGATDPYMRDVGGTRDGVELVCDRQYYDISADQFSATIAKPEISRKYMVRTSLLEATLTNLATAWGIPAASLSAGTLKLTTIASDYRKIQFVSSLIGSNRRKATFYKVVAIGSGGHSYKKDGEVIIPVEFEVLYDPTQASGEEFGKIVDASADTTAPTVSASTPANSATAVVVSADLTVTFSESIDVASAIAGFTVEKVSDGSITVNSANAVCTYVEGTRILTINPNASLSAATQYRLRVRNVADLEGNRLAADYIATFTTA